MPEPERGGASWLARGQAHLEPTEGERRTRSGGHGVSPMSESMRAAGVEPRASLVRDEDPSTKSLLWAVLYVLRIPSNVVLIVSSAFGYFFFAGLRAFGVEFLELGFDVGHFGAIGLMAAIGAGAIAGVYAGGRLGDLLLARGRLRGRVWVAAVAYLASAAAFLAGLLAERGWLELTCFGLAALALGAVNPPLDAARLDIMHPALWGRAEATRMTLRKVAEAGAPVLFGFVAGHVFGGGEGGLRDAFLLMLVPLFLSGAIAAIALRTYPRDAATAAAYAERTRRNAAPCPTPSHRA
jgi:hypothetical protein